MHDIEAPHPSKPFLDEDGLLRWHGRWVAIPDAQVPVVELLLERYGKVVRTSELVAAYERAGHSVSEASVRSLLSRIKQRVAGLGLNLLAVRGRGLILVEAEAPG